MARLRSRKQRFPDSVGLVLGTGRDFFGELRGSVKDNEDLLREAWSDPAIREAVIKRQRDRHGSDSIPWAKLKFGD